MNTITNSVDRFIRVGGFLFFLFGLLAISFRIIQFFVIGDPPVELLVVDPGFQYLQGIPSLFAAIFFLSGATALYLRQVDQIGLLGLVTFFVTFASLVISSGAMWTYAFTASALAREAPHLLTSSSSTIIQSVLLSMVIGQIGWLLLLIVSLRGNRVPRWALVVAILSIVSVVIMTPFAQTPLLRLVYNVLLGTGPIVVGFVLWRS